MARADQTPRGPGGRLQDPLSASRRPWAGPLGELAWHASLALYELGALGRHGWWWRLHRALRRRFRGLDPERMVREVQGPVPESLAYGETPAVSVLRLLEQSGLGKGGRFVDLGSGRGLAVLTAALAGYRAAGLEYFPEYVEGAREVAAELGLEVDLRVGDLLTAPWPEGDLYYVVSTAFGEDTRRRLGQRLARELPAGTLVVTLDWVLDEEGFEGLRSFPLPVTWGVAQALVWSTRGAG